MKVKFLPQHVEFDIRPNQSVLQLAQEHDLHIKSVCKGIPSCAECRVRITEGDHNVLPPSNAELNLIGTSYFVDQRRLSCQLKCFGDVTIDLSEQIEKAENAVVKKPRGPARKTEGESQAVSGSLLLDEGAKYNQNMEDAHEKRANQALEKEQRRRQSQGEGAAPKKSFYDAPQKGGGGRGGGRNSNRRDRR